MSGRGRVAATIGAALLLVSCAGRTPGDAPTTSWKLAGAVRPSGGAQPAAAGPAVASSPSVSMVEDLATELSSLGDELSDLPAAVTAAERTSRAPYGSVRQARGAFVSATQLAGSTRVSASGAGQTLAGLVAPLQAVSDAMNAGDRLHAALLQSQGSIREQEVVVTGLSSRVRSLRFELVLREREMLIGLAVSGPGGAPSSDPEPSLPPGPPPAVVRDLRVQLHRAQVTELELRQVDGRVKALSVRLESRRAALVRAVAELRGQMDLLDRRMTRVEALVGERYGIWAGGSPPLGSPLIGGVLQICPVDPPHAYSDDFGAPRWAGGFHLHQGNDIFAPEGTPIRAPFPGTAVDASNTLGGNAVKVYGDAGYVYNAHLVRFGRLGHVQTGDIIGFVGNTGDAVGTAPHDHFEWHPGNGEAVDPYPYLNAVCLPPPG